MKLPANTAIARKKLTHFLLTWRDEDDKSAFLARAGYSPDNADELEKDIRSQLLPLDAEFLDRGEYGEKYVIRGRLKGPNGQRLRADPNWKSESAGGAAKFVTLCPAKT